VIDGKTSALTKVAISPEFAGVSKQKLLDAVAAGHVTGERAHDHLGRRDKYQWVRDNGRIGLPIADPAKDTLMFAQALDNTSPNHFQHAPYGANTIAHHRTHSHSATSEYGPGGPHPDRVATIDRLGVFADREGTLVGQRAPTQNASQGWELHHHPKTNTYLLQHDTGPFGIDNAGRKSHTVFTFHGGAVPPTELLHGMAMAENRHGHSAVLEEAVQAAKQHQARFRTTRSAKRIGVGAAGVVGAGLLARHLWNKHRESAEQPEAAGATPLLKQAREKFAVSRNQVEQLQKIRTYNAKPNEPGYDPARGAEYLALQGTPAMGRWSAANQYAKSRLDAKEIGDRVAMLKAKTRGATPMPAVRHLEEQSVAVGQGHRTSADRALRRAASRPLQGDVTRKTPKDEYIPRIYLHGSHDPRSPLDAVKDRSNNDKTMHALREATSNGPAPVGAPAPLSLVKASQVAPLPKKPRRKKSPKLPAALLKAKKIAGAEAAFECYGLKTADHALGHMLPVGG